MATDTEDGAEGDEAEGVADVGEFPHPVGRNSRPSERAHTILENQRCFRRCDFIRATPLQTGVTGATQRDRQPEVDEAVGEYGEDGLAVGHAEAH